MRSRRFVSRLLAAVVLAALPARRSFAWGDDVHELIVRLTVRILPEEVRRALGLNERAMAAAAAEPDRRAKRDAAEGPRQYIDIEMTDAAFLDAWREKLAAATAEAGVVPGVEALRKLRGAFVNDYFSKRKFPLPKAEAGRLFDALPPKAEAFMGKVGIEGAGWIGTGPYTVGLRYDELARAASRCDAAETSRIAGELSHYVGDIHMPLHNTINYKGQFTGNLIIETELRDDPTRHCHVRYEVMVLKANLRRLERAVADRLVPAGRIREGRTPTSLAIAAAGRAYPLGRVILEADRELLPGAEAPRSWRAYNRDMYAATEEMTVRQIALSVQMTADLLYTACLETSEARRKHLAEAAAAGEAERSDRDKAREAARRAAEERAAGAARAAQEARQAKLAARAAARKKASEEKAARAAAAKTAAEGARKARESRDAERRAAAERAERERAEREAQERAFAEAAREEAEKKAAREKADREAAARKAAQERAEEEARRAEQARKAREASEKAAAEERAEREAGAKKGAEARRKARAERLAARQAEREAAEKKAVEERAAREAELRRKAETEAKEAAEAERAAEEKAAQLAAASGLYGELRAKVRASADRQASIKLLEDALAGKLAGTPYEAHARKLIEVEKRAVQREEAARKAAAEKKAAAERAARGEAARKAAAERKAAEEKASREAESRRKEEEAEAKKAAAEREKLEAERTRKAEEELKARLAAREAARKKAAEEKAARAAAARAARGEAARRSAHRPPAGRTRGRGGTPEEPLAAWEAAQKAASAERLAAWGAVAVRAPDDAPGAVGAATVEPEGPEAVLQRRLDAIIGAMEKRGLRGLVPLCTRKGLVAADRRSQGRKGLFLREGAFLNGVPFTWELGRGRAVATYRPLGTGFRYEAVLVMEDGQWGLEDCGWVAGE